MTQPDRLFDLLPLVHRMRDAEAGHPLRDLLRVITEQLQVVEDDITRGYDNWFVETAEDWVVPYLADLVGWSPVPDAGWTAAGTAGRDLARRSALAPRQDVANTLRHRRRKGTRALLEDLARDVAGLPGHAVEGFRLLARHQQLNHLRPGRSGTADLRDGELLGRLGGPFDEEAHTVDVRRPGSHRTSGLHNIPDVGLFVWRLHAYPVTGTRAGQVERVGRWAFTFDPVGFDVQLFGRGADGDRGLHPQGPADVPAPIGRRAFAAPGTASPPQHAPLPSPPVHASPPSHAAPPSHASPLYYGEGRSMVIHAPGWPARGQGAPVPAERVIPADLSDWESYRPLPGTVAVDPVLGRMLFPRRNPPQRVRVSYHYGFGADLGGGEYRRPMPEPPEADTHRCRAQDLTDPDALRHAVLTGQGPAASLVLRHWPGGAPGPGGGTDDELVEALDGALLDEDLYALARPGRPVPAGVPRLVANRQYLETLWPDWIRPARWYRAVRSAAEFRQALHGWEHDRPRYAVIEITGSEVLGVTADLTLEPWQTLLVRAAERTRPVLWLADRRADGPDAFAVALSGGSRLILDGLVIGGRAVHLSGAPVDAGPEPGDEACNDDDPQGGGPDGDEPQGGVPNGDDSQGGAPNGDESQGGDDRAPAPGAARHTAHGCRPPARVVIRHCTLVPGWGPHHVCGPERPAPPSLELAALPGAEVEISHSIVGPVRIEAAARGGVPLRLAVNDSILDATHPDLEAVGGGGPGVAPAVLEVARTTVLGSLQVHAIEHGENTVFLGEVLAARRSTGCLRFCWVPTGSRTPRRFHCQPDTALAALGDAPSPDLAAAVERRLRPRFTSVRHPDAGYAQLAPDCPDEIRTGADDGSELGAFHDLFLPQRLAALRARAAEYTPAGVDTGVVPVN
ncbi:hypothetical protein [Kitasatospora sp. NPDC056181]|uniref:hypothetical protein n=1 Tax=Kitasatospora sp. NPDC056181 TaxID=3345737 RepID=UPI0035DAF05D